LGAAAADGRSAGETAEEALCTATDHRAERDAVAGNYFQAAAANARPN
jgi:hypothetical protein